MLQSKMVNFEESYLFSRFQRGSNIFQGGSNFFQEGGSNCLFPIETHITCDFPGGGPDPLSPSGSALGRCLGHYDVESTGQHFVWSRSYNVFVVNDNVEGTGKHFVWP